MMDTQTQLEGFEGREHEAYPDPDSHGAPFTIGVGHTGPEVHPGLVWTDDQIDDAFQLDFNKAWQGCVNYGQSWFTALAEPRQAVLVNMAFEAGVGILGEFAPTMALIAAGHFDEAAAHIRASELYRQAPTLGDAGRAARHGRMVMSIPTPHDPDDAPASPPTPIRKPAAARENPAEQWRPYKPGIEINGRGQLRTTDAPPKPPAT